MKKRIVFIFKKPLFDLNKNNIFASMQLNKTHHHHLIDSSEC